MKKGPSYVKCLIPLHLPGPLTYIWPFSDIAPQTGMRVILPLRGRKIVGIVWGKDSTPDPSIEYKEVDKILDYAPLISKELMEFIEWASSYYMYPLGKALAEALPSDFIAASKKAAQRISSSIKGPGKSCLQIDSWEEAPIKKLTDEQTKALSAIQKAITSQTFSPILLFGVTGSGKTQVYIEAAKDCLRAKKGCLIMVPEIAMTTQLASRFKRAFGDQIAILHSKLTPAQRRDQWWRLRQGKSMVALGTRSAIFSPVKDLGLIVVDEEHDTSYKQEERFRYNARDLAVVRAKMENAVVLMGSGTPAISSFFNAQTGRYKLLKLLKRPSGASLPLIEIVDRTQKKRNKNEEIQWITPQLKNAIEETLDRGEQILLFLNRRGFATYIFCPECGHVFKCKSCDVILTWHRRYKAIVKEQQASSSKGHGVLTCHYCGDFQPAVPVCPSCGGKTVKTSGFGTEKVSEDFVQMFPGSTVARIDRDTLSSKKKMEAVLKAFRAGKIDCLVGTQMVTKGHDFPNLTLVGILWADMSLNIPEYNASERTFQTLSQVAGRAGRSNKPGKVLIQTYSPDHYSVQCAASHDYITFYNKEIELRKTHGYPPFERLINLRFSGSKKSDVQKASEDIRDLLLRARTSDTKCSVLGPAPCPKVKIRSKYRYQILLKGEISHIRRLAAVVDKRSQSLLPGGIRMEIDVDPLNFM